MRTRRRARNTATRETRRQIRRRPKPSKRGGARRPLAPARPAPHRRPTSRFVQAALPRSVRSIHPAPAARRVRRESARERAAAGNNHAARPRSSVRVRAPPVAPRAGGSRGVPRPASRPNSSLSTICRARSAAITKLFRCGTRPISAGRSISLRITRRTMRDATGNADGSASRIARSTEASADRAVSAAGAG